MAAKLKSVKSTRTPISQYGTMDRFISGIRENNPMDLTAEAWEKKGKTFKDWQKAARSHLKKCIYYDYPDLKLNPKTVAVKDRGDFIQETIEFNTAPWERIEGYFLLPKNIKKPVPGLVVFHAWGGPKSWGKDRIVNSGRDHIILKQFRKTAYSGNYLAEEFAKQGFAVIVIDAYQFGKRIPRHNPELDTEFNLFEGIAPDYDPFEASKKEVTDVEKIIVNNYYTGIRYLNWAGTTWAGLNAWEDKCCVDYLLTRPEVDSKRIGCTGLSGGGWRTNMLAALDKRIKASVSVGWMTAGNYQHKHDILGTIGVFAMIPGVFSRMDVPDLAVLAAPGAAMVLNASKDDHFTPESQRYADKIAKKGYKWAGVPDKYQGMFYEEPHCYCQDMQNDAIAWLKKHLG
ncbi:MAG: dienelactone hydrolase family protein [Planctomycetota bacterium]|jgi:dienelactone hydrolase